MSFKTSIRSAPVAVGVGLLAAGLAEAVWFYTWLFVVQLVDFLLWSRPPSAYLDPPFVIPLLYMPFLARAIALRMNNDPRVGRASIALGVPISIIATWAVFVYMRF